VSDFDIYFKEGIEISLGHGYQARGAPTAFWPVGYPAFLGALFTVFGRSLFVAKLANVLLYIGIIALSFRVATVLFRGSLAPKLTLLILSFYPNHIAYTSLVASEILFLFLVLLGAALLLTANPRLTRIVLSGAVFGLTTLVRPQALFLPLVFVLLAPGPDRTGKPALGKLASLAILYASLLLVVLPWTSRNYRVFGHYVLVSTNGGGNLLIGNNDLANGAYDSRPEFPSILGGGDEYEQDVRARKFAITYVRTHPLSVLKRLPRKLWYFYAGDVEGIRWNVDGLKARGRALPDGLVFSAMAVADGYYLLVGAAFIASLFLLGGFRSRGGAFPLVGLGVVAYFACLSMIFFGGSRFHFPVIPWIAMYAAALPEALGARAPD